MRKIVGILLHNVVFTRIDELISHAKYHFFERIQGQRIAQFRHIIALVTGGAHNRKVTRWRMAGVTTACRRCRRMRDSKLYENNLEASQNQSLSNGSS